MSTVSIPALVAEALDKADLPARPPAALDAYLDAVEACVCRYGWSRTSPKDIARAAGVERTTIYRHLGAKDAIFHLLLAREVHRLIDWALAFAVELGAKGMSGPNALVELLASAIERVRDNPATGKILADEPELISSFIQDDVPKVIERFSAALGPLLGMAMEDGIVAKRDPGLMTEWMVRMGLSVLFAPPRGDMRAFLGAGIHPLFATEQDS